MKHPNIFLCLLAVCLLIIVVPFIRYSCCLLTFTHRFKKSNTHILLKHEQKEIVKFTKTYIKVHFLSFKIIYLFLHKITFEADTFLPKCNKFLNFVTEKFFQLFSISGLGSCLRARCDDYPRGLSWIKEKKLKSQGARSWWVIRMWNRFNLQVPHNLCGGVWIMRQDYRRVCRVRGSLEPIILQHDNIRPHTERATSDPGIKEHKWS